MKYASLIFILVFAGSPAVFAERGGTDGPPGWRHKHMERMVEALDLSKEQEPQVRQILEEQHGKMRGEMEKVREQMKPKMEAIHAETTTRLAEVLDDKQMQSFNDFVEKKRNKWSKHKRSKGSTEE